MSFSKLTKFLERPFEVSSLSCQPVLVADSKGNYLRRQFESSEIDVPIRFVCKSGATFRQQFYFLQANLHRFHTNSVFFIFLGTCDLTSKRGRFIQLSSEDESSVRQTIDYIDRFNALIRRNGSKIVFLEIPPYSIVRWNSTKGHSKPDEFVEQDRLLSYRIALINEYIQQVNSTNSVISPKFRISVLRCHSNKRGKRYTINYNLYTDGVHPTSVLCQCWLRNILTAINRHCR